MALRNSGLYALLLRFILACAVASTAATILQAQGRGTLKGTILDPQGAAAPGVGIELRWNSASTDMCWTAPHCPKRRIPRQKFLRLSTDRAGAFSVDLPPGYWDVFAYHDGLAPTCTIVYVTSGEATDIELRLPKNAGTAIQ